MSADNKASKRLLTDHTQSLNECSVQLLQKLDEAKDENGLLSQALQDLQVGQMGL